MLKLFLINRISAVEIASKLFLANMLAFAKSIAVMLTPMLFPLGILEASVYINRAFSPSFLFSSIWWAFASSSLDKREITVLKGACVSQGAK